MAEWGTVFDRRSFHLDVRGDPPPGYPRVETPDRPRELPEGTFETRRREYLAYCVASPAPRTLKAPWYELPRMAAGRPVYEGMLEAACEYVRARLDCADFLLHALLRQRRQFASARLSPGLEGRIRDAILGAKYWPDEPGVDSLCTWTENHQILYASAALVAGRLYPEDVFGSSGRAGRALYAVHRPRVLRWLDLRFRTGFSEWLSNVYYDEDVVALVALMDFAGDPLVERRAAAVLDLLLLDLALHTYRGVFASTHGRSYADHRTHSSREAMTDTTRLLFGTGCWARVDNMSAVALALSPAFRLSPALAAVAREAAQGEVEIRQRMGFRVAASRRYGVGFRSLEDGMVHLAQEAYLHPRTASLTLRMFDAYRWWDNAYFAPFRRYRALIRVLRALGLLPALAWFLRGDLARNTREEANLVTWRSADGQLSSAVDYRKGRGGDQHAIWQATLAPNAVCFVTHPAGPVGHSPDYWTGEGSLPRVAQHRNVLVSVYRVSARPGLYRTNRLRFTHAWLPEAAFDEVVREGRWVFARKGDGYLALWARNGLARAAAGELVSPGVRNIWVCELGRAATHGSFAEFRRSVATAPIRTRGLGVRYQSPSLGWVRFGWRGGLRVGGGRVPLNGYPRYDCPWVNAPFDPEEITVRAGGESLRLCRAGLRSADMQPPPRGFDPGAVLAEHHR